MNQEKHKMTDHFALVAMVVLGATLMAGCTSTSPDGSARAQNDLSSGQVSVKSPDGAIEMTIRGNGPLTYSVAVDGKAVLSNSRLGLKFKDGVTLGANARLAKVERSRSDTTWENKLGKRRIVRDRHNELRVCLVEQSGRPFDILVRAFDDGIGFRYVMPTVPLAATQDFVRSGVSPV